MRAQHAPSAPNCREAPPPPAPPAGPIAARGVGRDTPAMRCWPLPTPSPTRLGCAISLILLFFSLPVLAAARRVAVLELRDVAGLSAPVAGYLTDRVRTAGLGQDRFFVMTRENILAQLPPGTDLASCEGDCEVETGRNVGADVVISGEILKIGEELRVSLKVHDTATGKLVAAETAAGATPALLEGALVGAATRLFERLPASGVAVVGGGQVEVGVALEQGEQVHNAPVADDFGFLVIDTDPPGGRILLDGRDVGTAPLQREEPIGRHLLEARLPLHYAAGQEVVLTRQGARVVLKLPPAHGRLVVESDPPGATVRLGGEVVGQTPFTAEQKPSGRYTVRVEAPCRTPAEAAVVVQDGQTTRQVLALARSCGDLQVESEPPGAQVVLNGTETGQRTPAHFTDLQPGVATVRLRLDGHGESVARSTVEPRETTKLSVKLTPKLGWLAVLARNADQTPCEGELRIDGRVVGATPWKGEVVARRLDVSVRCPGGVAHGRAEVAHNERARLELVVGAGQDDCDAELSACIDRAGIDDRTYRDCFQAADGCVRTTQVPAQVDSGPPEPPPAALSWLVQVDRLRDYYLFQGVLWLGRADRRLRGGLAANVLNLHFPAEVAPGFGAVGFSFGSQILVRLRLAQVAALVGSVGINGGFLVCNDGGTDGARTATEQANHDRCVAAVGEADANRQPSIGFGLFTTRLAAEARIGQVSFLAGWALTAPFGVGEDEKGKDLIDFGPLHGVSLGLGYEF